MGHDGSDAVVGVLGQWASGKSTAAKILVEHLGGQDGVVFLTDRELLAGMALRHVLEADQGGIERSPDAAGGVWLEGELAKVYLPPGEDPHSMDLNSLLFDIEDAIYDEVPPGQLGWFDRVRLELGRQILESSSLGVPVVIEAGFGTNADPRGENPFRHTVADLFTRLGEAGVAPGLVGWIIIQAGYETRVERNRRRSDKVPQVEFDRFAADGGDLTAEQEAAWRARGLRFVRVQNDHADMGRFSSDILAACDRLLGAG